MLRCRAGVIVKLDKGISLSDVKSAAVKSKNDRFLGSEKEAIDIEYTIGESYSHTFDISSWINCNVKVVCAIDIECLTIGCVVCTTDNNRR